MQVPEGYTEQQVLDILKKIGKMLATKYSFGYYSAEDIEQEIFILGMDGITSYSSEKGKLENFLFTHVSNRLKNFRRDNFYRKPKDCAICKDGTCDRCQTIIARLEKKQILVSGSSTEEYDVEDYRNNLSISAAHEDFSYYLDNIPLELRSDFLKMAHGRTISKHRREKVEDAVIKLSVERK